MKRRIGRDQIDILTYCTKRDFCVRQQLTRERSNFAISKVQTAGHPINVRRFSLENDYDYDNCLTQVILSKALSFVVKKEECRLLNSTTSAMSPAAAVSSKSGPILQMNCPSFSLSKTHLGGEQSLLGVFSLRF